MTDQRIIDTIAGVLMEMRTGNPATSRDRRGRYIDDVARDILAALRGNGMEIVDLPEPDGLVVAARDGLVRLSPRMNSISYLTYTETETRYLPAQARALAAALLAAAAAAETTE